MDRAYCLVMLVSLIVSTPNFAAVQERTPTADLGSAGCESLRELDFLDVQDAPTEIVSVEFVQSNEGNPAYCRVDGYVLPQVGFELQLPTSNWNGKLIEIGCGGACGYFAWTAWCPMQRGYACIVTDMGHKSTTRETGIWAYNNVQAQIDFGFRSTHVTALVGKAIVASFYKKEPTKSMMLGCSTGGYQAMVEAQLFPWDFDGIVAIAPDMSEADLGMRVAWHMKNSLDKQGKLIFDAADLRLLHSAALAKCDMTDGVRDGIVGDPVGCSVDPSVLTCKRGQASGCLTAAKVDAAKKIYDGPTTSDGRPISTRGVFPGSELNWSTYGIDDGTDAWSTTIFRYMFTGGAKPDWKLSDFDFDRDYKRLGLGVLYSDTNPDLRKLKASGGKLIVAQGGNDVDEIPGAIFDYYDTVLRTMGGRSATEEFFRLFLVPGMNHCTGGEGAFAIDYLSYLEAWVERGEAPNKMIGAHVATSYLEQHSFFNGKPAGAEAGAFQLKFPLSSDVVIDFTRPVYPYPLLSRYKGVGDPNSAESFEAVEP